MEARLDFKEILKVYYNNLSIQLLCFVFTELSQVTSTLSTQNHTPLFSRKAKVKEIN